MPTLSKRNAVILVLVLFALMWATRGQHVAMLTHLPDASWAIFLLLGFYFRNSLLLPLFLAQAALADCLAIIQLGASDYCVTPAYMFLLPAYSILWLAGRWCAAHYQFNFRSLPLFATATVAGSAMCELISSGSFYFLGGRFSNTSLAEFVQRLTQYFPADLENVALYLGVAALLHALIVSMRRQTVIA